jgi:tagaturonate reductase
MAQLCRRLLQELASLPNGMAGGVFMAYPEKVVQFGEGNFLRGFADWMIDVLNEQRLFEGRVLVVQPVRGDRVEAINSQDGLYTVVLRGLRHGVAVESRRLVTSISRALSARADWAALGEAFCRPGLRFVISNTTEAGITFVPEPLRLGVCPESFPAKVAALLYQRFLAARGDPAWGLVFLPCELIERNGETLRRWVLEHAQAWGLSQAFSEWVTHSHHFLNTLVDRIVAGFPHEEAARLSAELGYEDRLLVAGELYHLWVIEGPIHLAREIPFHRAGLNVVWVDDLALYRTRKVRILNGVHTAAGLAAFLGGLNTVGEMMADPLFGKFVRRLVFGEILPSLSLPGLNKEKYAGTVLERLRNPSLRHELLSIALNSVSKWRVRILPSLLEFQRLKTSLPSALSFSLAALISFYKGARLQPRALAGWRGGEVYPIRDEPAVLDFFEHCWNRFSGPAHAHGLAETALGYRPLWDLDLNTIPGLTDYVAAGLALIQSQGVRTALESMTARGTSSSNSPTTNPDELAATAVRKS